MSKDTMSSKNQIFSNSFFLLLSIMFVGDLFLKNRIIVLVFRSKRVEQGVLWVSRYKTWSGLGIKFQLKFSRGRAY